MTARLYVGAISGTSVDGLDLALIAVTDALQIMATSTVPFSQELRDDLVALAEPGANEVYRVGSADARLGDFIGAAILAFLNRHQVSPAQIAAIGSHGQTIRHHPEAAAPFTVQIGDPNRIAERTGITTVADFRRRDMAAGGQGAPLVPPFHKALFWDGHRDLVLVNLGGIANLTRIHPDGSISGFDTGPANALLDAWALRHLGVPFDEDGAWAANGQPQDALLQQLLADPFLHRPPPKSTGKEHYNLAWLDSLLAGQPSLAPADVQATLIEFTAASVADAVDRWAPGAERLLLCGGGRRNGELRKRLTRRCQVPVATVDEEGVDGDGLEAAAFAWLAHCTLNSLAGSDPGVTGAAGGRILGGIYPGAPGTSAPCVPGSAAGD